MKGFPSTPEGIDLVSFTSRLKLTLNSEMLEERKSSQNFHGDQNANWRGTSGSFYVLRDIEIAHQKLGEQGSQDLFETYYNVGQEAVVCPTLLELKTLICRLYSAC